MLGGTLGGWSCSACHSCHKIIGRTKEVKKCDH